MGTKRRILLHLAALLAGWGIARPLLSPVPDAAEAIVPGKASVREARDREAGEKLLRRLVPDLAPAPPLEVVRHEGTLEERAYHAFLNNNFPANPGTPGDDAITGYLREEIHATLYGRHGPDLSYAFFHGRMDARRVLDTLRQTYPDLAGEEQFTLAVFRELFPVNPARAADLLAGLPAEDRSSWLNMVGGQGHHHGPEGFLAILNLKLLPEQGENPGDPREEVSFLSAIFHGRFGNDYAEWLLAQPPSKCRERMLGDLIGMLESEDPAAASALQKRLSTR